MVGMSQADSRWQVIPDRSIRVGLVGYGLAGEFFHAPLIRASDGLDLVAVVTSREVRPGTTRVASTDELLTMEVDLVVVATPNATHVPIASQALAAGAHVVVDKPLAVDSDEAAALVEQASAAHRLLSVFQNRRWDGDFLTLLDLLGDQRLGRIHRFESRFERWRPEVADVWRESSDPVDGGGLLLDLGAHLIDQAVQLFGYIDSVYAEISRVRPGASTEDDVFLALRHHGGEVSHLSMSSVAAESGPRMRVLGEHGAWTSERLDSQEESLRAGSAPGDAGFGANPDGSLNGAKHPTRAGDYAAYYRGIERALRFGDPSPVDASDAVEVLRIIELARRSAATRATVTHLS